MPNSPRPLLELRELSMRFQDSPSLFDRLRRRSVPALQAVSEVSLSVLPGEVLGLVGESGCGKSTLARVAVGLLKPSHGEVLYRGAPLDSLHGEARAKWRRAVQMVFQDPYASLNPRLRVDRLIGEAALYHGVMSPENMTRKVSELLQAVGLSPEVLKRYPHEFSGGQRQRIGIARALALQPELIVCDEPVAALDVSVQAQVLNLLMSLRRQFDLSYLFISHDLGVVRFLCDRIAVMYLGRIVELGPAEEILSSPRHPYTQALVAAMPNAGQRGGEPPVRGEIPSPFSPPVGCSFHPRCSWAQEQCRQVTPVLRTIGLPDSERVVACVRAEAIAATNGNAFAA